MKRYFMIFLFLTRSIAYAMESADQAIPREDNDFVATQYILSKMNFNKPKFFFKNDSKDGTQADFFKVLWVSAKNQEIFKQELEKTFSIYTTSPKDGWHKINNISNAECFKDTVFEKKKLTPDQIKNFAESLTELNDGFRKAKYEIPAQQQESLKILADQTSPVINFMASSKKRRQELKDINTKMNNSTMYRAWVNYPVCTGFSVLATGLVAGYVLSSATEFPKPRFPIK